MGDCVDVDPSPDDSGIGRHPGERRYSVRPPIAAAWGATDFGAPPIDSSA
jgi:hypothetical protein